LGGALINTVGWRSIFWLLFIYSGVFLITLIVILHGTLWSIVGNGAIASWGSAKLLWVPFGEGDIALNAWMLTKRHLLAYWKGRRLKSRSYPSSN
jgi:hypothetical protein